MKTRRDQLQIYVPGLLTLLFFFALQGAAHAQTTVHDLQGQVIDEDGQPVARVEVIRNFGTEGSETVYTDAAGRFTLHAAGLNQDRLSLSKPGFFRIRDRALTTSPETNEIIFTLNHETELQQRVEVQSDPVQIDPNTTSHQESLVQHEILNAPVPSGHDLQQYLKTIPQVVGGANGQVHVAGARQEQTEVLLDGFEINDPASGAFTSRVDVDAVRSVTIETGGYGAEYAHAGASILKLDTQTGDDKWRFNVTNFVPDVSFQQGVHFGNWYPRTSISGPLKMGRAWFSDALSLQHNFVLVRELPPGRNIDAQWSGDNLFRAQVNLTSRNILQASFLVNRWSDTRQGLGAFSPLSTTSKYSSQRYFVSVKDQIWLGRTLFDVGAAADTGGTDGRPQGNLPYVVTPSSTSGNYFQTYTQNSRRLQFLGNVITGALHFFGTHTLSAGWNLDGVNFSQLASRGEIDFERADASLSDRATFRNRDGSMGPGALRLTNTQLGGYAQDVWRPWKPIVFSVGVRTDWDDFLHENVFQPRIAMNWVPAEDGRMKIIVPLSAPTCAFYNPPWAFPFLRVTR